MKLKHIASLSPHCFDGCRKVVTHSHFDRQNKGAELCSGLLKEWCSAFHVDALGVGSPWTPAVNADYRRAESTDRDRYYANPVFSSEMYEKELSGLIGRLNASGNTLFYPDNETPKGRNGHLWYFNYRCFVPPWHDYSQDRPVKYYWNDPHEEINKITGKPHFRRPYYDVIAEQRRAGALAVWAHPTSWWRGPDGGFVTNIAAELPVHLLLDGGIDGLTVSGYDPFHRSYRALYFMLLDRGYRIPAFAEMDLTSTCLRLAEPIANYIMCREKPESAADIAGNARTGNCFIGNGIRIAMDVDGCAMGGSLRAGKGKIRHLKVCLVPAPGESVCSRLEITGRGGKCLAFAENCGAGEYVFEFEDDGAFAYFSACAFGEHDSIRKRQQEIKSFSMTNPVWLVPEKHRFPDPAYMTCSIRFRPDSPFLGGRVRIPEYGDFPAEAKERILLLPANSVLELVSPHGETFRSYPFFEDEQVQSRISELSEGHFLQRFPQQEPGEVPAECFDPELWRPCLDEIRAVY